MNLQTLLEQMRDLLADSGSEQIWSDAALQAGLRQALARYSQAWPHSISLSGEISSLSADGWGLASVPGLTTAMDVQAVKWPAGEMKMARLAGWRVSIGSAGREIWLRATVGSVIRVGDAISVQAGAAHTVDGLDGAEETSVPSAHSQNVLAGACGVCALQRAIDLIEITGADLYQANLLGVWGRVQDRAFQNWLDGLRGQASRQGTAWMGSGWPLEGV